MRLNRPPAYVLVKQATSFESFLPLFDFNVLTLEQRHRSSPVYLHCPAFQLSLRMQQAVKQSQHLTVTDNGSPSPELVRLLEARGSPCVTAIGRLPSRSSMSQIPFVI